MHGVPLIEQLVNIPIRPSVTGVGAYRVGAEGKPQETATLRFSLLANLTVRPAAALDYGCS